MAFPPGDLSKEQKTALKRKVWALRARGLTQEAIAKAVGRGQKTVSRWLADMDKKALERLSKDVERQKVAQSQALDHIYQEAIQAWHREQAKAGRISTKTITESRIRNGEVVPIKRTEEEVLEDVKLDVSYLNAALKAQADKRKLWGLDAPIKQELKSETVNPGEVRVTVEYVDVDIDPKKSSDPASVAHSPDPEPEVVVEPPTPA